ncbi:MAG: hypothetical protein KDC53_20455, partial [Saprospiraceae bacterium]|nr:hypothetical protein [Saprospiraceae bacterium]
GIFSDEQLDWLLSDLAEVSTETPIVVTTHIPMICTRTQLIGSANTPNVANSATIFQMMENHNLKLILQGHIHWTEYGYVNERFHFLTGGSIAGNGWKGRRHNTREGFMLLSVNGEDFDWQYVDHGWESERIKRKLNEEVVG